ncbi:MAG: site-specific DNA-methyltransferase [Methanobrevibacter sp.]|jgi:adenine-specific DNA-methyltransferase|nr:site-specific DNA-methyltransferase [Candidatus Methanovirga basalitermitum]
MDANINKIERERERESTKDENKKSLIESLELEVHAGSLEPTNFNLLKKLIESADNLDDAISIRSLGLTFKKTGLHYQQKLEKKQSEMIHYLEKNNKLSFDQGGIKHKLIIGDNYQMLKNLLITHRNKIDVIYIDPPYGANSMGEFADTNYENNITRDNLLSMLEPRLRLAKDLMSDGGVIFCSIDDKNQAYLKLLFDEVFGENNFISNLVWIKKHGPGGNTSLNNSVVNNTEYILFYAKNIDLTPINQITHDEKKLKELGYKQSDKYINERGRYKLTPLFRPSSSGSFQYIKSLDYKVKAPDGEWFSLHCNKNGEKNGRYT